MRGLPFYVIAGVLAAAPVSASAAPEAIVVVTENDGLSNDEAKAALAAAIDVLSGGVELGSTPEKAGTRLKAHGSDPLKCGGEVKCIVALGREASVRFVLAVGIGRVSGDYPVSVTVVDVTKEMIVARQATLSHVKPEWGDVMRDLIGQAMPQGTLRFSARISLSADVFNAEVYVDDNMVGTTPLDRPIPVNPGSHKVKVTKAGYESYSTTVEVEPSAQADVDAKLELIPPPAPPPPSRPFRYAAYAGGGLTAAGIVVTVVLQVKMNLAASAFLTQCEAEVSPASICTSGGNTTLPPDQAAQLAALQNTFDAARVRWAVSLSVTAVVAVATAGVVYWDLTHPPAPVSVALGPGGVNVFGRF